MITTVGQEAGAPIFSIPFAVDAQTFSNICLSAYLDPTRTSIITSNPLYALAPGVDGQIDGRVQLQLMGTDQQFRCSSWTFAKTYVQHGGNVYVGQFVVGATYPPNGNVPFCTQSGNVCHQDDIQIVVCSFTLDCRHIMPIVVLSYYVFHWFLRVNTIPFFQQFGTVPNPTTAQATLISQMQKRYKSFLSSGNPNAAGVPIWTAATATNVHPLLLGGTGEAAVGACTLDFWGGVAQYDYQFFNQ